MNKIIAVFLVALCMTVCVTAYSDGVQADLQDNLIRLHFVKTVFHIRHTPNTVNLNFPKKHISQWFCRRANITA